jgi:hypothetical protein
MNQTSEISNLMLQKMVEVGQFYHPVKSRETHKSESVVEVVKAYADINLSALGQDYQHAESMFHMSYVA